MTDAVSRQAVIDAVRRVPPGTSLRGVRIIEAINALPSLESVDALVKAARDFVAKVDRGEARSKNSYAAFTAALSTFDKE